MRDEARRLDAADPLAAFRGRFVVAEEAGAYLDGNSLGRLPRAAAARARELVEREWGEGLIGSWNRGWLDLPARVGAGIAAVLGAAPDEVLVADSTSVNLFKLAVAALRRQAPRRRILTDDLNFPSDHHVLRSALAAVGGDPSADLEVVRSPDGVTVPPDLLLAAVTPETALVSVSHTAFKSAYTYPLAEVTAAARDRGALVLWDLSHSAGSVPTDLRAAGADLAVGCTYKYLCGGPGSPAFLYVRRELQEELENPVGGWFGAAEPFAFSLDYTPAPGLRRFLTGTPPVVSLALVECGVDLVREAGLPAIRAKSVAQTEYLIRGWEARLAPLGYALASPRESARRGSHVSLRHPEAGRITQALIAEHGVIPDFRAPDCVRLGVCPLYTRYEELARAQEALAEVVVSRAYEAYPEQTAGVT
jgi:kynureninase